MKQEKRLHLGCGKNPLPTADGWINLDQCALPGVDVVADLDACATSPLPFADNTFAEMIGSHVFEHVRNPLPLMQELHRISKPGGRLVWKTPYGSSDDAWENPTHVRAIFLNTYVYYAQPYYFREDYGYRGDWDTEKMQLKLRKLAYPPGSDPERIMGDLMTKRNVVIEAVAHLRAVKPIHPMDANLRKQTPVEFVLV